jgi:competence protein ComEC
MRPPILWIAIGFGAGVFAGLAAFSGPPGDWISAVSIGFPLVIGALAVASRAPVAAAAGLAAVAGLLWSGAAVRERSQDCAARWTRISRGSHAVQVRLDDPAPAAGGVVGVDVVAGACGGALRLRWPAATPAAGGTTWLATGTWLGDADRGVLVVRGARLLDGARRGRGGLRGRIADRTAALFGTRAPLVDALVLARRGELEPAVRERYASAGLAHLLSISGLHVGFLAAWLGVLLRLLRLRPVVRYGAATTLVFLYLWLLGFPPSAVRAGVMLAVAGLGTLRQRVTAPRGAIALAALVLLALDPASARSVGAWLSVSAVAAVIWAVRATAHAPRVVRALAPAVAATLATAPISAYAFGVVAPVGVLANLIAIPIAAIAVPGLLLALVASVVLPPLGTLLAAGSGAGLALLDLTARAGAAVPFGHVVMVAGWRAALLWAGVLGLAWWLWHAPRRGWVLPARMALVAALVAWSGVRGAVTVSACRCLQVDFLDVGQGDAEVIRTPAGHWVVIDGGPRAPGNDAGRRVVVPFLRRHGAHDVALVVSTHSDADHLGGLPAVLDAFRPQLVLDPGEPIARPLYFEFLADVEAAGIPWRAARAGDMVTIDSVTFTVLSPDDAWMAEPADVNDHGIVLLVTYGRERLLFQADAGLPVEARLAGRVGRVDVLKVGHHGSRSASSESWLEELSPGTAVISVGARNRYGHPAPEVVERLRRLGITVLRTDQLGTITFASDGQHATFNIRDDH